VIYSDRIDNVRLVYVVIVEHHSEGLAHLIHQDAILKLLGKRELAMQLSDQEQLAEVVEHSLGCAPNFK